MNADSKKIVSVAPRNVDNTPIFIICLLFSAVCLFYGYTTDFTPIMSDGLGYYVYLPAFFIDNDLSFKTFVESGIYLLGNGGTSLNGFNPVTQIYTNPYAVGTAILQTPFFLAAHLYAKLFGGYEANGFSSPYQMCALLSEIFYANVGLYFSYLSLRKYFDAVSSTLSVLCVAFSTGLMFYVFKGANFSHVFSFSIISIFLFFTIDKGREAGNLKNHIIIGALLGIVGLCRSTNILVGFIYIFWGISSISDFKSKLGDKGTYMAFFAGFISFVIFFSPQMLYWKYAFGGFLVNSYGVSFDWSNPHVYEILFSFYRGLFVWHPIFIFMFIGFVFLGIMKKPRKEIFLGSCIFILAYVYMSSSWPCWWYGWSYGQRTYNDILAVLSIPLGALIESVLRYKSKVDGQLFIIILILVVFKGLGLTWSVAAGRFPVYSAFESDPPDAYDIGDFVSIFPDISSGIPSRVSWFDPHHYVEASFGNPSTLASYHGLNFAYGPGGSVLHGFKIAGDGKAYYRDKEILNEDSLSIVNYPREEMNTGNKWLDDKLIYRTSFSGKIDFTDFSSRQIELLSGVDAIVDFGGSVELVQDNFIQLGAYANNNERANTSYLSNIKGMLVLVAETNAEPFEGNYSIWVEYTKNSQ